VVLGEYKAVSNIGGMCFGVLLVIGVVVKAVEHEAVSDVGGLWSGDLSVIIVAKHEAVSDVGGMCSGELCSGELLIIIIVVEKLSVVVTRVIVFRC
jgi:hypothetical protein